ncbi:VanZ family protein [Antarcticirhabdus aurantiaca]|uniref:VanZ family protein n=1 Tax=Antarcticirhabdus aurantiaca TaxID=2606717 RepID=A0ACD4NUE0_9HYPH|nr:VanZ family protein [Antarcticirhabdus aurantiaca]WAJ30369.1 VanZ family protein [Jeongeuplla avenae]
MDYPRALKTASAIAAWGSVAFIAFATMSPIQARPHLSSQGIEHLGAFALVGLLFGIAHPRRLPLVAAGIVLVSGGLEAAQHLTPDRHGKWVDFGMKVLGGGIGLGLAAAITLSLELFALRRRQRIKLKPFSDGI